MSIQNYLNQIKNAVFGKDVRQSIYDAIKQCYDDASIEHDNANMEVKLARGSHDTLNERFTSVEENIKTTNEQLEQNRNELIEKINEVATTGTTTEVLQVTTETYIQEKLTDGTIANLTIKKDSITDDKVKFLNFDSNNLADFRNKNIIENSSYSPSLKSFVVKEGYYRTEYILLKGNKTIYGKWCGDVYFFDDTETYIGVTSNLSGSVFNSANVPTGATKMVVSVPNDRIDKCVCSFINKDTRDFNYSIDNLKIEKEINPNSLVANKGQMINFVVDNVQNAGVLEQGYKTKNNKTSYRVGCIKQSTGTIFKIVLDKNYEWETLGFWVYVEEKYIKKMNGYGFSVRVKDNNINSEYSNNCYRYAKQNLYSGWNFVRFSKSDCIIDGVAPKTAKTLFISCSDIASTTTYETFSVMYIDSVVLNYKLKPTLAIMHDGMWGGLKANGFYDFYVANRMPITVGGYNWDDYTLWDSQYETDGVTKEQLYNEAMRLSDLFGFEMGLYGGHRNTHGEIREGTDVKVMSENISNLKNTLNSIVSYEPISYVCSQGVYNHKIEKCLKMNGIKIARTTGNNYITGEFDDNTPIFVGTMGGNKNITAQQYKDWIDKAISGGYCCTIFSHNASNTVIRDVDTTVGIWTEVLNYIKQKKDSGELLVLPLGEIYRRLKE